MNKQILLVTFVVAVVASTFAAGTVSNVKARQRYPWNGKVDIDCTLTGEVGTKYALTVNARDKVGGTNLTVTAVSVEGETAMGNPVSVTSGVYRLVWDADADLPNGYRCEKLSISVSASEPAKKYMIVDLQSGAITYQSNVPDGGWMDAPYKLTKMAFQRVEPGTFDQVISGAYTRKVKISKPYYVSVFPVTKGHLETLGVWDSFGIKFNYQTGYVANSTDAPSFMAHSYNDISFMRRMRGNEAWPAGGHDVVSTSPLGVIRTRSGNQKFDLPTEAQLSLAFKSMVINDGGLGCLDRQIVDLRDAFAIDPVGPVEGVYVNSSPAFVVLNQDGAHRATAQGHAAAAVRFCLYEAD